MNGRRHGTRSTPVIVGMVGLLAIVLAVAVSANLWKQDLRVASILVEGNRIVTSGDIVARAGIGNGQRLFDIDLRAAASRILENGFIRSAWVSRDVPDRIRITVVERVPVAAVVTERILYLDAEGYVLPPVVSENIFDLPVLTGTLPQNLFVPGRQIGTQDVKEGLNVLITVLTIDDELSRRISEIHLEGGGNMTLYAAEYGVPILFGQGDVVPKIVKLASFWREVVSRRGAHGLQYIDLRFDDQVVVRWVDGEEGPRKAKTLLG